MILSGRSHHEGFCRAPGFIVHGVNLLQGIGTVTDEAFQGFFDDGDNIEEADAPVQKSSHRNFVGGIQHGRRGTARPQRVPGDTKG